MTYRGKVKGGVIVLDGNVRLPEGMDVQVESTAPGNGTVEKQTALRDDLLRLAGSCEGLPPDLARNHDHYLYGVPKRKEGE